MATIKLNEVRKEFKRANVATVGNVLSVIYALVNEYREKQRNNALNNEQVDSLQYLTKILPPSKTQAKKHIPEIEKYGNVGCARIVKKQDGTTSEYIIRPSVDMVLRYFVAEYNKNVPEAKVEKKRIEHECKAEKKQTANTTK